jgi:hypothetical protein
MIHHSPMGASLFAWQEWAKIEGIASQLFSDSTDLP